MNILQRDFEYDLLRALQYLYYVDADSPISDQFYDEMQKAYEDRYETTFPVGSDSSRDYSDAERHLAHYITLRGFPI